MPHLIRPLEYGSGSPHLWGSGGRRGWSRKRTSAPQMSAPHGSMPRVALVLRSRRSWPVAPQSYRRTVGASTTWDRLIQEQRMRVPVTHSPSIRYPIPYQKVGTVLITPLGLQASKGDGHHLFSDGLHAWPLAL
ncbi:hypothetical protein EVAR_95035_1 [Eumeta japonica]|uniref:Uncharacterized protein n=1 Tax=Eumeta variegata TaxID=151549 RepID=A0A4C1VSB3_EUMVA|nr:hypothetical protein EVAR_95035_1 [Eumeta japonica]